MIYYTILSATIYPFQTNHFLNKVIHPSKFSFNSMKVREYPLLLSVGDNEATFRTILFLKLVENSVDGPNLNFNIFSSLSFVFEPKDWLEN